MRQLHETKRLIEHSIENEKIDSTAVAELRLRKHKMLFSKVDAILDKASFGPKWLGNPAVARMVQDALLDRYAEMYRLWAYVVMVNHLHCLLTPKPTASDKSKRVSLSRIMKSIKGYTAREANRILKRTGQTFWQQESFDHWARDRAEFFRIIAYIENNPVKAGLVQRAHEWPWSSAAERLRRGWTKIRPLT
jgi:REP element-mobilizing transposase RayT